MNNTLRNILSSVILLLLILPVFPQGASSTELSWGIFPRDKKEKKVDSKISPQLSSVVRQMQEMGVTRNNVAEMDTQEFSTSTVKVNETGSVQVYIYVDHVSDGNIAVLEEQGVEIEIVNRKHAIIQGWTPVFNLEDIAALDFVVRITPPDYGEPRTGSVKTEGDAIMRSDEVREILGFDGSMVRIGVISDGVDNASSAQATGDLPPNIIVNPNLPGRGDEGTAMLEIIHDIAPGAELAFSAGAAGVPTSLEFIESINFFLNEVGADIIVDDLFYPGQPYFEDGIIAQEAAEAVAQGAVFITSAGNGARRHYQAQYIDSAPDDNQNNLHDFGVAAGGQSQGFMRAQIPPGVQVDIFLQWNDPFTSSSNDYDLLISPQDDHFSCIPQSCASIQVQDGNANPLEIVGVRNTSSNQNLTIAVGVNLFSGAPRTLELFFLRGQVAMEFIVMSDSVVGHASVPEVIAVGAVPASSPDTIQPFSARGPSTVFFPFFEERPKPDLVATDGVSVTGAGGFPTPFFGTSAAAPHVAGAAALLLSADPSLSPLEVMDVLMNTAVDLGTPGFDLTFGAGRVDAFAAVSSVAPEASPTPMPTPTPSPTPVPTVSPSPVNGGDSGCALSTVPAVMPGFVNLLFVLLVPFIIAGIRTAKRKQI